MIRGLLALLILAPRPPYGLALTRGGNPNIANQEIGTMSTRCKFTCRSVENYGLSKKVNLQVVYEGEVGKNEENKRFTKATPSGECWLTIDNPAASVQFVPGRDYYATFEEAPASSWNKHAYDAD